MLHATRVFVAKPALVQQRSSVLAQARAELILAESVHMNQVLGKQNAVEAVSDTEIAELQKSSPRRTAHWQVCRKKEQPGLSWSLNTLLKLHVI